MRYISTRGAAPAAAFADILLEGLAPDGGLYVPEQYPSAAGKLDTWRSILDAQGYAALAASVLSLFAPDIEAGELEGVCSRAYNASVFATPEIVPVTRLADGRYLAHLSDGPSAAFKDLAMQFLGQMFEAELSRRGQSLNILGATSGDTGSSAEYAMLGRSHIRVFMLTPEGRMTPFQQAQMYSIDDPAIVNIAVDGVFDDCQDLVKAVSEDLDFKAKYSIGAVNSINWARVAAQVVYYIACWLRVSSSADEPVSFCVPTGNFGNILAGHVARQMGVPIKHLILATNENNVLDEFFHTGIYRVRPASGVFATSSPSMDISKASNFERFVFDLFGGDAERVRHLFGELLPSQGFFDISSTPEFKSIPERFGFLSGSSTHADRLAAIRQVWASDKVMIDPHTADAVTLARRFVLPEPCVVMETALPVKFQATMEEAIHLDPPRPARFAGIEEKPKHYRLIGKDVGELKGIIREVVGD
ncbi:MAG: threonine synthase [Propionibacteriaceae bacterium]|jgi:threonine synthase|nr:threonine synthase [Propionibacteriaceae bacterium]